MKTRRKYTDPTTFTVAVMTVKMVAAHFGITLKQLESHKRPWHLVWPRFIAIELVAENTGWSQTQLGYFFNRDHQSIRYALATTQKLKSSEQRLAKQYAECETKVRQALYDEEDSAEVIRC